MRLFCTASVIEYDDPQFQPMLRTIGKGKRSAFDGARAVIVGDIWEVQTSCGYGVPRVKKGLYAPGEETPSPEELLAKGYNFEGAQEGRRLDELCVFEARPTMDFWAGKQVDGNSTRTYQKVNNKDSIDGLPGLKASRRDVGETLWVRDVRAWVRRVADDGRPWWLGFLWPS